MPRIIAQRYLAQAMARAKACDKARAQSQLEGPSLADIDELCAEFKFHCNDDSESLSILRDMISAAITRWRAPVTQPAAQPVSLAELRDPDFSDGMTPSQHLDVVHSGADPRVASTAAAPGEAGSESIEAICERVRRKYDRSGRPVPKTFTMVEERRDA